MPRLPRFNLIDIPQHVVQRGHNRHTVFLTDDDRACYLDRLAQGAVRHGVDVHAWCLMTNHVHLLLTPRRDRAVPHLLQYLGGQYVTYFNVLHGRSGTLWEGRYKASLVDTERYLLDCYRYIELNPVRAAMVADPALYPWSSYCCNALGARSALVSPHPAYLALGDDASECRREYRRLVSQALLGETLSRIRDALKHNHVLGDERFKATLAQKLAVRFGPGHPGRPRKDSPCERRSRKAARG